MCRYSIERQQYLEEVERMHRALSPSYSILTWKAGSLLTAQRWQRRISTAAPQQLAEVVTCNVLNGYAYHVSCHHVMVCVQLLLYRGPCIVGFSPGRRA